MTKTIHQSTKLVTEVHIKDTIKDITQSLRKIRDKKGNWARSYNLQTLLCRIGELESCLDYNYKASLKANKNKEIIPIPNRLCTCYDRSGSDQQ